MEITLPTSEAPNQRLVVVEDDSSWNSLITGLPHYSYYQSQAWGEHKKNQGWKVIKLVLFESNEAKLAYQVLVKEKFGMFGIFWIPGGPVGDLRAFHTEHAKSLARHLGIRFYVMRAALNIESRPEDERVLLKNGWHRPIRAMNSGESLTIDLENLEQVESKMTQNWRHNLKRAAKKENKIERWENFSAETIERMYDELYADKKIQRHFGQDELKSLLTHCRKDLLLLKCTNAKNEIIGFRGACVIGKKAWDMLAVTGAEGKQSYASYQAFWCMLLELRQQGIKYFDFAGVDPVNNPGVFHFKKGSGADHIRYLGEFETSNSSLLRFAFNKMI